MAEETDAEIRQAAEEAYMEAHRAIARIDNSMATMTTQQLKALAKMLEQALEEMKRAGVEVPSVE
jgi:HPt (histidine-containing phosphotransfer) domain-containing protein